MMKYELFWITLVSLTYCFTCQETMTTTNEETKPPDKTILHKSQLYPERKDQRPFTSKIIEWVLPFNKLQKRVDITGGLSYISPSSIQNRIQSDCHPCNREPWIPIIPNIKFVPNTNKFKPTLHDFNDLHVLETLHPPPVSYKTFASPQYDHVPLFKLKDTRNNYALSMSPQFSAQNNGINFPIKNDIGLADYMLPPPVEYRIPSLIYGSPKPPPTIEAVYRPPNSIYNSGQHIKLNHPSSESVPLQTFLSPPGLFSNIPQPTRSTYLHPVSQSFTPLQPSGFSESVTQKNVPVLPSDSYGAPVTGDSLNYFSSPEQLSLPNENNEFVERPLPLPNLSSYPVLPFRNGGNFNENLIENQQNDNSVKIQQSVQIADYLAAIEHPINVIQSPIIELSVKDDGFNENENTYQANSNGESIHENSNNIYSRDANNLQLITSNSKQNIYQEQKAPQKSYHNINEQLVNSNDESPTKLSENPIIVEDVHGAASTNNNTFVNSDEVQRNQNSIVFFREDNNTRHNFKDPSPNKLKLLTGTNIIKFLLDQNVTSNPRKNSEYTPVRNNMATPIFDYHNNWRPTYGVTMSSLHISPDSINDLVTTKKPKILQIVVPYITSKTSESLEERWLKNNSENHLNGAYTSPISVHDGSRSTTDLSSVWSKFRNTSKSLETERVLTTDAPKVTTEVYNIKELLDKRTDYLFHDIVTLQKHIDDWTQQAYSQSTEKDKFAVSKKIPTNFFTTQKSNIPVVAAAKIDQLNDNSRDSTEKSKLFHKSDDGSNIFTPLPTIYEKSIPITAQPVTKTSSKKYRGLWDVSHVTVSPQTKEKVYIVTPQTYNRHYMTTPATAWSAAPKIENGKVNNGSTYDSYKFSVRVEPHNKDGKDKLKRDDKASIKVIYSEWPHLINNLQASTVKPPSRHPLFGLMDILAYTISSNSTTETTFGPSRVSTIGFSTSMPYTETTTKA